MADFALPLLFALAVWWSATALVMFLDGLPRTTFRWTLLGTTALQLVALYGLWETRDDTSVVGAYVAFACAVATWGWQEVFFLTRRDHRSTPSCLRGGLLRLEALRARRAGRSCTTSSRCSSPVPY